MLARIAHELYWLGRNLARAEFTARAVEAVFQAELQGAGEATASVSFGAGGLVAMLGSVEGERRANGAKALERLALDAGHPGSMLASIERAREGARTVRDVISAEMWEAINTTTLSLRSAEQGRWSGPTGPYVASQHVKQRTALIWGIANRSMLRDEAKCFLDAGGLIEVSDMVLRMLRVALAPAVARGPASPRELGGASEFGFAREPPGDDAAKDSANDGPSPARAPADAHALILLQAVGGFHAYLRAVTSPPNADPVARFLIFERAYPDSVAACVDSLHEAFTAADAGPRNSKPVLRVSRLAADLDFQRRALPDGAELTGICARTQQELSQIDQDVAERYFAGAAPAARW
jgi:uncharacterized alpha-E superfamily protein